MECSVCFEDTEHFSICNQCNESSIMCYTCEKKWIEKMNDPTICHICKNNTRINIHNDNLQYYILLEDGNNIESNQQNQGRIIEYLIRIVIFIFILFLMCIFTYLVTLYTIYKDTLLLDILIFIFILFICCIYICYI